jgi:hypothetical protein
MHKCSFLSRLVSIVPCTIQYKKRIVCLFID